MISRLSSSRKKSSSLKAQKKLLAEKTATIAQMQIEIDQLRKERDNAYELLKQKDYTISRMEDILNQKRVDRNPSSLNNSSSQLTENQKNRISKRLSAMLGDTSVEEQTQQTGTCGQIKSASDSLIKATSNLSLSIASTQTKEDRSTINTNMTNTNAQTPTSTNQESHNTQVKLRRQQRQGISAAPIVDRSKINLPKRNSKICIDPASSEKVCLSLLANEFLAMIEKPNIKLMSQCVQGPLIIKSGTKIIVEGEPGDGLYILEHGTVQVTKGGQKIRTIATDKSQKHGVVFGELACLYNCQRTASIEAVSECRCWYLDRDTFQAISIEAGQNKIREIKDFLKKVTLFSNFPERKLMKLIDAFEVEEFEFDTFIIRQNAPGDSFYIIADGEVEVNVDGNFIRTLKRGDYFGEKALLEKHCHRTAAVVAKSELVSCLCLEREDFLRLIGPIAHKTYHGVSGINVEANNRLSVSSIGSPEDFDGKRISNNLSTDTGRFSGFDFPGFSDTVPTAITPLIEHPATGASSALPSALPSDVNSLTATPNNTSKKTQNKVRLRVDAYKSAEFGDLEYITTIGVGGFGRVELVRIVNDVQPLALKRIKKAHVKELKQEQHVINERVILLQCNNPFIIKLYRTYRDRKYVYLLSEACLGGELWTLLRTKNYFMDSWARFYTACAVEALDYLHCRGVVYRDLKPENLVLMPNGYAKLCDFGFAKKIGRHGERTYTFCGTPEYVPPEIILNKGHDFTADLWALGIFIYELTTGTPPFNYNDNMETYRAALRGVALQGWGPDSRVSKGTREIILALAKEQPNQRLGAGRNGFKGYFWRYVFLNAIIPHIIF